MKRLRSAAASPEGAGVVAASLLFGWQAAAAGWLGYVLLMFGWGVGRAIGSGLGGES